VKISALSTQQVAPARVIKYKDALEEAYLQCMERDPSIFIAGIGVDYSTAVFGTTSNIIKKYGSERIFDTPAMENALTGIAIGAAAMGKRPVIVHLRNDFMFLAFDQLINLAAKWKYMYGGNAGNVPIVVRAIIGRGWGQGATHSQSLHAILGYFPGLHVVMPAFPSDAKGLTIAALQGSTPTIIFEHRSLFDTTGLVDESCTPIPIGKANIAKEGTDISIIAVSQMAREAIIAAEALEAAGVNAEVIDVRSIRPFDSETILKSLKKTGRILVIDNGWKMYGIAGEVCAICAEDGFNYLKAPVKRIAWEECPQPVSKSLEDVFYPTPSIIAREVLLMLGKEPSLVGKIHFEDNFKGPY
jgi:pyruvate dehydrogenase E1 component beta subunit